MFTLFLRYVNYFFFSSHILHFFMFYTYGPLMKDGGGGVKGCYSTPQTFENPHLHPNDDTQNYPFCSVKLVIETFLHSTKYQSKFTKVPKVF